MFKIADQMKLSKKHIVIASPFLIVLANFAVALTFGKIIGKWAFIPMVLIGWSVWSFLILKYGGINSIKKWLGKPKGGFGWGILAVLIGLITLPLFVRHHELLNGWTIWLPWILLALINPWIEEFYWRGLLLDYTKNWPNWIPVLFVSILFALNHIAFGINSNVNSGIEIVISTFIMGVVWAIIYKKTKSLRWAILSHFLIDFFGVSSVAFLDLFEKASF